MPICYRLIRTSPIYYVLIIACYSSYMYVWLVMLILLRNNFQQHAELDSEYVHTCSPLSANLELVLA